jgi:hypothetical protein
LNPVTFTGRNSRKTYPKMPAQETGCQLRLFASGKFTSSGPACAVQLSHAALREVALTGRVTINRQSI